VPILYLPGPIEVNCALKSSGNPSTFYSKLLIISSVILSREEIIDSTNVWGVIDEYAVIICVFKLLNVVSSNPSTELISINESYAYLISKK